MKIASVLCFVAAAFCLVFVGVLIADKRWDLVILLSVDTVVFLLSALSLRSTAEWKKRMGI